MGSSPASVTRSFRARVGAAAKGTASAPSTLKLSSGIAGRRGAHRLGDRPQLGEETVDGPPYLGPPREPAPAGPDKADQLVAAIDGHQAVVTRASDAADEQRLDVGL